MAKHYTTPFPPSACDQCGHTELGQKRGFLGSFWKVRAFELQIFVCLRCGRALSYVDPAGADALDRRRGDGAAL